MSRKSGFYGGPGAGTKPLRDRGATPTFSKSTSIAYGTSNQVYTIGGDASATEPSGAIPSSIDIINNGVVPLTIMMGYETYSNETTGAGATRYLHTMLMPGQTYSPTIRAVISTQAATTQFDGTALDNQVPNANMYTDSTADVDHATASTIGSDATHTTLNLEDGHSKFFRVGDLIRLEN